ncbi:MAG: L-fuculokinase, partial [Candidatus Bathyarchaeia archaeon]
LWVRDNMPHIFQKAWKFVCFEDYLIFKLCGVTAISHSLASRTMMLDIQKKKWSSEILETIGLDPDLLSEPYISGKIVGEVSSKSSQETGLAKGTAVLTGGHDQSCGALGVGITKEGPVMDASGSVECIAAAMKKPVLTEKMLQSAQCCYCHTVEDMYLTLGFFPSSGIVLRWYRDTFAEKEKQEAVKTGKNVYDILTEMASASPLAASKLLLLPHFVGSGTGPFYPLNRNSRGAIVGLSMFHKREDIIRAILEGVAFELRRIIESIEDCKIGISEIRAVGGGAKSPFWLQIKADVTNREMVVPDVTEAPSLGAAILAGIGTKTYMGFEDAVTKVYRKRAVYEPDAERTKLYDRYYRVYKKLYPALVKIFDDLALL